MAVNPQRQIGWTFVVIALPCVAFAVFFLFAGIGMRGQQHWQFGMIEGTGLALAAVSSASLIYGVSLLRHWRFSRHSATVLLFLFAAFWGFGVLRFASALAFDTKEFVAEVLENPATSLGAIALSLFVFMWCVRSLWLLQRRGAPDAADA